MSIRSIISFVNIATISLLWPVLFFVTYWMCLSQSIAVAEILMAAGVQ